MPVVDGSSARLLVFCFVFVSSGSTHTSSFCSIVEDLGFKTLVMKLLTHESEDVQQAALLCVQKMMVKNWEFLGR